MDHIEHQVQRYKEESDEVVARAIYKALWPYTVRLAYGLLGNKEDAEDVSQKAWIKIFVKIGKYDPQKSAFKTWVTHITRNKCIDFLRWRKLQWVKDIISLEQVLDKQDVIVQDQPSPDETMTRKETKNEVWQALQSLPSKYREVVLLRDYFDYTWRDIAFILNCAIGTAHYRHQRAYEKLESILGENYSSDFGEEYE